ncbi:MAG: M15 family metallopeptidase [Bacteroidota bacterium]
MCKHVLLLLLLPLFLLSCSSNTPSEKANDKVSTRMDSSTIVWPIPQPSPDYDTSQWVDILDLDSTILLDMRYATNNNFVKEQLYDCGRCFLRPEVGQAVRTAHRALQQQGLGLKLFDCFRPRPIQQKLWEKVPNPNYVTPPKKGSMHNRGMAVDVTIVKANGEELDMGTGFDYFGQEAHHTYTELPDAVLDNRQLLKETMAAVGLRPIRTEWWHYSYSAASHELSDMLWKCED